jgi:hypothetical protein
MWIPRWLGECYSKLFARFGQETFSFQQAKDLLSINENRLSVAFSKLHSRRILLIVDQGRPRRYRVLDPENFILLASETIKNLEKIPQERYLKLLCDCFRETVKTMDVESFAIYGSVARGRAALNSDIDIMLISDDLTGSLGARIEKLYGIEEALRPELEWLSKNRIRAGLSFYPLRKSEAQRLPSLFLDLTDDGVILYDRNRFLEATLLELKMKLLRLGARRIFIDKEKWYWDLKPDYKFGETIAVA